MKQLLVVGFMAGSIFAGATPAAQAGGSTDAALGLGAFAVFNQLVRGETVLHDLFGLGRPAPVMVQQPVVVQPAPVVMRQPVIVPSPPAVVYVPHGGVYVRNAYQPRSKKQRHEGGAYAGIPPGHLPPPGECRLWFPGRPPGHQPPPGPCAALQYSVPPGAYLIPG